MSQAKRYIEPTAATRAKLILAYVAPFVVGFAYDRAIQPTVEWISTLPTCESLPWVRAEIVIAVGAVWLVGILWLRTGLRIWTLDQVPLPSAWVWSRTEVKTGRYARLTAIGYLCIAVTLLVAPVIVILTYELYAIFCYPQACGC
jgi:hypothetical protein